MKNLLSFTLLLIIGCNFTATTNNGAAASFDLEAVKQHIHTMNASYSDRFTNNDTAFYNSRYCKDAISMPERQAAVVGIDSIRSFCYGNGSNKDFKVVITAENIYGTKDLVVEEGVYSYPDGKGGSFDNGKFIALWKQEGGTWKLYREIWNTNVKPNK